MGITTIAPWCERRCFIISMWQARFHMHTTVVYMTEPQQHQFAYLCLLLRPVIWAKEEKTKKQNIHIYMLWIFARWAARWIVIAVVVSSPFGFEFWLCVRRVEIPCCLVYWRHYVTTKPKSTTTTAHTKSSGIAQWFLYQVLFVATTPN